MTSPLGFRVGTHLANNNCGKVTPAEIEESDEVGALKESTAKQPHGGNEKSKSTNTERHSGQT